MIGCRAIGFARRVARIVGETVHTPRVAHQVSLSNTERARALVAGVVGAVLGTAALGCGVVDVRECTSLRQSVMIRLASS